MWNFLSRIFKKEKTEEPVRIPAKAQVRSSKKLKPHSIEVMTETGDRYLKLKPDDCGIVIHGNKEVEILFTKAKPYESSFSETEEALMALAVFMKQEGFLDMIQDEFKKIASAAVKDQL